MGSWFRIRIRIRRATFGSRAGSLGTWKLASWVACPVSVSPATEAFGFGFDLGEALSALLDAQIGSDDFTLTFGLAFTLPLSTTKSGESCQLKLDGISYVLVIVGFT